MPGERSDHEGHRPAPPAPSVALYLQHPPGWYPDPHGDLEHRWWGGTQWGEDGGGTLLTESVLLMGEKVRVIEGDAEYAVRDQRGRQIGAVRHLRERGPRRLLQWLTSDPAVTRRRQVKDDVGDVLVTLTRPTAAWLKPRVIVGAEAGQEIGRVVQQSLIRPRVTLESGGQRWGEMRRDPVLVGAYTVRDHAGVEVARLYRLWRRRSKRWHTSSGDGVVQLDPSVQDPLRTLVVSAALAFDLVVTEGGGQFYRRGVLPATGAPGEADAG